METNCKLIGIRIRKSRKKLGISQASLAEMIDVSPPYISLIEAGAKQPSLTCIINIASALNTSIDYLITGTIPSNDLKINSLIPPLFQDCSDLDCTVLIEILLCIKSILIKHNYMKAK